METYDQITAAHYAAYRPPLHEVILKKCLGNRRFGLSLDVGCGTGSSTIPLTYFCDQVIGIDPSREMLSKTVFHSLVKYALFNGQDLEFEEEIFDLITFAGSIVYAKSQRMLEETVRVTKPSAFILLYDFEILIGSVFELLNIPRSSQTNLYNHRENFDGLNQDGIELIKASSEEILLPILPENLAHLLLSDSHDYAVLSQYMGKEDCYAHLVSKLGEVNNLDHISAKLYYSLYRRSDFFYDRDHPSINPPI